MPTLPPIANLQAFEAVARRRSFALAAAGSDVGIMDWDVGADRMFASRRALEILGLPPDGPESRTLADWLEAVHVHPDDAASRSRTRPTPRAMPT